MNRFWFAIVIVLLLSTTVVAQNYYTYEHNGITRDYILFMPANMSDHAPLVFVLHGYTGSATNIMTYSSMNGVASEHKFVVCYPQGMLDNFGTTHWNAQLTISDIDDIEFLASLAIHLQEEYDLDAERTFACGMSNGGFMSYTLACQKPDVFKAIASVTGTMSAQTWENRNIAQPIPVLQIHGINDNVVPIDGSMTTLGGWGGAPPLDSIISFWADVNHCTAIDSFSPSAKTHFYRYSNQIDNNEVWYYKLEDWGHEWPGFWAEEETGINASKIIWEFFNRNENNTDINGNQDFSEQIAIYPNPFNSYFQININGVSNADLFILNSIGKLVYQEHNVNKSQSIDLDYLSPGLYIVRYNQQSYKIMKSE